MNQERKIIQIATKGTTILAVCNDGTVWGLFYRGADVGERWEQLPPIPQPEPNP